MNNLVYYSVGYNSNYNKLLILSVYTLKLYYTGDILIITNYENSIILKQNNLFDGINFMIIDDNNEKFISASNRYRIFEYEKFYNYDSILYLDCDTLIINSIDEIFKKTIKNKCINIVEEKDENGIPKLMNSDNFFGRHLFNNLELKKFKDKFGLNSGVFCLPTTKESNDIFNKIYNKALNDFNKEEMQNVCNSWGDQPYFNYILFTSDYYFSMDECFILDMRFNILESHINDKKDYNNNNFNKYIKDYSIIHLIGPKWGNFELKYKKILQAFPEKISRTL